MQASLEGAVSTMCVELETTQGRLASLEQCSQQEMKALHQELSKAEEKITTLTSERVTDKV